MPQVKHHHVSLARAYVRDVLGGKIAVCKWVRLACERQRRDLQAAKTAAFGYYFDPIAAEKICDFVRRLRHVKGKWAGQTIQLEPWQCFILTTIFGWRRKSDGARRFRQAYLEIPRKNGKSIFAAGIGLYMLVADNEAGAEVYSGATSEHQAWEVFRPAKMMATSTPGFREHFRVSISAGTISVPANGSRFQTLIGNPGDGASPHCAIHDEFHEHKTPEQSDTMKTGMGARMQPLQLYITTAGSNLAGPCYDKRKEICKVLESILHFEDVFGIIYTIDDDDDWTDLRAWRKANPNFGISVFEDFMAARRLEGIQIASRANEILRKHLNVWTNASTAWMNMVEWRACADAPPIEEFSGEVCTQGVDLSTKIDIASRARLFTKLIDGVVHYYAYVDHYLPEKALEDSPNKAAYEGWSKTGRLHVTPGGATDIDQIEEDIEAVVKQFEAGDIGYDPFQAQQMANHLNDKGFAMVEVRPTVLNFSEPMKELEALVKTGRFHHDGDPVLEWMVSNVVAHYDKKDNIYPNKERPENKIDGVIAVLMALARLTVKVNEPEYQPWVIST